MPNRVPLSPLPGSPLAAKVPEVPLLKTHSQAQGMHSQYLHSSSATAPLGLLPSPTAEDVAGFVRLYERKYGATLESDQAQRLLSGLMRFLYLTRTLSRAPVSIAPTKAAGVDADDGDADDEVRLD